MQLIRALITKFGNMPTTESESYLEMVWNSIVYLKVFILMWYYALEYAVLRYIVRRRKDLSKDIILVSSRSQSLRESVCASWHGVHFSLVLIFPCPQVTGSGRGIGRELCLELSKSGAKLVCWSRTAAPNEDLVQRIRRQGGTAYAYTVDVGDRLQVERAAAQVRKSPCTRSVRDRILVKL